MKQKNEDRPALSLLLDKAMEFGYKNESTLVVLRRRYATLTKTTLLKIKEGGQVRKRRARIDYTKCMVHFLLNRSDEFLHEADIASFNQINKFLAEQFLCYLKEE